VKTVRNLFLIISTLSLFLVAGCQSNSYTLNAPEPGEKEWAPTVVMANSGRARQGSLYAPAQMLTLFQDRRAYRTGDILTVTLDESTESSKRAGTSIGKKSDVSVGAPSVGTKTIEELSAGLNADRRFNGESSASQRNSLSGFITVTVSDVMANGVLAIKGEKWLRLNQGDEYIRLHGLVRVDDIDDRNRVSSQRIADAQITYAGRGALAESNEPGWLSRVFQSPLFLF
jgi:flagellar L-ring protein FlgH